MAMLTTQAYVANRTLCIGDVDAARRLASDAASFRSGQIRAIFIRDEFERPTKVSGPKKGT
jgi:hypothetical protein